MNFEPPSLPTTRRSRSVLLVIEGLAGTDFEDALRTGCLPTLAGLKKRGALTAELSPPLPGSRTSALATVMTGCWPDQHGALVPVIPGDKGLRAIEAGDRSRPAVWEMLDLHGIRTVAVGWPASAGWQPQHGVIVDAGFGGPAQPAATARLTAPSSFTDILAECWMKPDELDLGALSALVPSWETIDQSRDPRLAMLAGIVAQSVSRHAAFLELIQEPSQWDFATLVLQLPAELARLEALPVPGQDGHPLSGLNQRGLELLDAFVGAILAALPEETCLTICGLADAEASPTPAGSFVLLHGPVVVPDATLTGVSLLDLAPTLGRLHGWTGTASAGRPLEEAFRSLPPRRPVIHPWPKPGRLQETAGEEPTPSDTGWLLRWQALVDQLQASSLMARGEWLAAMPFIEHQLTLQPDAIGVLMRLIECQYFAGLHREALENAWDVLDLADPDDPVPLLAVAGLEATLGRFPEARRFLDQAAPLVLERPGARLFQARVLIHLRQWQEAKRTLTALSNDEPRNAAALGLLARAHLGLGEWSEAIEAALRSTDLNFHDAQVHEILGMALLKIGLSSEARSAFTAATEITPSWPRPWARLTHLVRRTGGTPAEVERLAARYRLATQAARKKEADYLESVKTALAAKQAAHSPTPSSLTAPSSVAAPVPAAEITGLLALSGTDPDFVREIAGQLAASVAGESRAEPPDALWVSLLGPPATRSEPPLKSGELYLMPASIPARLPKQHVYRLAMLQRSREEILNDRRHLPRHLAGLDHEDLLIALADEKAGLIHLAEFSPNLQLLELPAEDFKKAPVETFEKLKEFLRIS